MTDKSELKQTSLFKYFPVTRNENADPAGPSNPPPSKKQPRSSSVLTSAGEGPKGKRRRIRSGSVSSTSSSGVVTFEVNPGVFGAPISPGILSEGDQIPLDTHEASPEGGSKITVSDSHSEKLIIEKVEAVKSKDDLLDKTSSGPSESLPTTSSISVNELKIGGEISKISPHSMKQVVGDVKLKSKAVVKLIRIKTEEYEVERIKDYTWCKHTDQGLYLVKWMGWDNDHDSWEPAYNLNCPDKLKDFYMERMSAREKATPAQKRVLPVPPDPRTHFEKRNSFVKKIFSPPCYAKLDEFFQNYKKNKIKILPEKTLNKFLDSLSKMKTIGEKKLNQAKEQLMLKYMLEARKEQKKRLDEWEREINLHESTKIVVENEADLELPPRHMTYITKYMPSEGISIPEDPPIGCECTTGICELKNEKNCCSGNNDTLFPYDKWGRLRVDVGVAIFECNKKCTCDLNCPSKVVQKGRKVKLCIFRTDNGCGWGVKAMEKIKKGTFVSEYVGEVIRNEEAEKRGKKYDAEGRTYLFDLDFNRGNNDNLYTVDAAYFGNVAHFINHSCDPNLSIFNVWIDCLDPDLPRLCLFARRDIAKGEQITFDYCQQSTQNYEFVDVVPSNLGNVSCHEEEAESGNSTNENEAQSGNNDNEKEVESGNRQKCYCGSENCRQWLFD